MADKYYLDFVGLNTFIYEPVGWDEQQLSEVTTFGSVKANPNHRGYFITTEIIGGLNGYKNFLFSHKLPNTASFFPALMLHRNGPYGHPSWKQLRVSQNPLTRKQVKENIFTYVEEPGPTIIIQGAQVNRRHGDIKAFVETPVISRYKPVLIRGASAVISERTGRTSIERFDINSSFGNSLAHFNNEELDKYYGFIDHADDVYDEIKNLYLSDGLDSFDSPMDIFEFVRYSETVYPKQLYTNKSYTRQRTTFSFDWRDNYDNRIESNTSNEFGSTISSQSFWPLDTAPNMGTYNVAVNRWEHQYGYNRDNIANGILQNNYSLGHNDLDTAAIASTLLNSFVRPAPVYNRKHILTPSASVVSPNGMRIEGVNFGSTAGNLNATNDLPSGEAKWEAGDQAGKNPFYDSYDDYVQGVRQRGKGYTIVPEFRISNHIPAIVAQGIDNNFSNMLEMTGGLSSADGSDKENFYKIYSTTDFLKHFDIVKEDHKGFVEPFRVKIKCKAIKKFLPYNGFYPCQRTVEIAQQFYSSYSDAVTVATGSTFEFKPLAESAKIGFQNLLTPLFAPGVLFNAIKSGVACDYPVVTSSVNIANGRVIKVGNNYYLSGSNGSVFDQRIPFDALVEPQKYLSQTPISCNEPHIDANHSSSVFWDGTGDNLYKMMAHNFLAEVPNFFLQGQQFSTIYSLPSNDPNVGNAIGGRTYKMRVKMYKSTTSASAPESVFSTSINQDSFFTTPQYSDGKNESFTMYSRPTAFGPPFKIEREYVKATFTGNFPTLIFTTSSVTASYHDPDVGENYAYTPPYYYGQAWADIHFTAESTKKYTLDEIIADSKVFYYRNLHPSSSVSFEATGSEAFISNTIYNTNAMQLSASVNLFAQGNVEPVDLIDDSTSDKVNVAVDISSDKKSRWIIQPYFETPMLNFNHLSSSTSVTLPTYGSQSVPRGMWHQYGRIETDTSKGIFLQVTDVPNRFRTFVSGSITDLSLAKLCGFKNEPKRLGKIAQSKVISEAVVAIPFIEEEGQRKFFKIDSEALKVAKSNALSDKGKEARVGKSIIRMVEKMRKFVIPPSLDFVHRTDIDPFAMYIFEFKHTLSQQDLADIWQNLPPTVGRSFEEAEVSISHDLLAHELLGGGETIVDNERKKGPPLPDKIQWLVFKAKQRAETNYYDKVVGERDLKQNTSAIQKARQNKTIDDAHSILRPEGVNVNVSYNWPYDFFSLVELIKIDAEVTLADTELKQDDNFIIPKRGQNALAGLPTRAQQRIQESQESEQELPPISPNPFFR